MKCVFNIILPQKLTVKDPNYPLKLIIYFLISLFILVVLPFLLSVRVEKVLGWVW